MKHVIEPPLNKYKILLVDDDYAVHYLSRRVLLQENVSADIFEVYDGREALDFVTNVATPDIILLDVNMHRIGGYEFLMSYKHYGLHHRHTRIFMLTGAIIDWEVEKFTDTGIISGYFEKPLQPWHVETIMEHVGTNYILKNNS